MKYECKLSPQLQKKAFDELHEDANLRNQDIQHIREWIKKQPHLNIPTDDWTLLRFLRGCKFSLEKTKEKIDMHYTVKSMLPEWFQNRDPKDSKLREILELGIILPLKECDDQGRRVFFNRSGVYDPKDFHVDDIMKVIYMLLDLFLEEDEVHSITGFLSIMDMKNVTAAHMLHMPPTKMKKMMVLWQDGYAIRTKGLIYMNMGSSFETVFNMFKGMLNEKIRNRVKVFGTNWDKLYEEVPKRILPKEYGGEGDSLNEITDYWMKRLDARRDWFLENSKYGVDESKRPGKAKSTTDIFGMEGSFRKLNVD